MIEDAPDQLYREHMIFPVGLQLTEDGFDNAGDRLFREFEGVEGLKDFFSGKPSPVCRHSIVVVKEPFTACRQTRISIAVEPYIAAYRALSPRRPSNSERPA